MRGKTVSVCIKHTHKHAHSLSLSAYDTHTHTHTLSLSLCAYDTHTHTHTHTHSFTNAHVQTRLHIHHRGKLQLMYTYVCNLNKICAKESCKQRELKWGYVHFKLIPSRSIMFRADRKQQCWPEAQAKRDWRYKLQQQKLHI